MLRGLPVRAKASQASSLSRAGALAQSQIWITSQLSVTEAYTQTASCADERIIGRHQLCWFERGCQGYVQHPAVLPGNHTIEFALSDQVYGMHAECRSNQPIVPGRLATPLHMAERGHARFRSG